VADTKNILEKTGTVSVEKERYSGGYGSRIIQGLSGRKATREAAFFLPYLRSGMSLLDCGCGPGSMTVDFAEVVAPSEVIGIDLESSQFEVGRALALERGVKNVRFVTGNIYELPFSEGSFDAVFVHAVLYHLSDPHKALAEVHRVLKSGGVVGVRDSEADADIFTPSNPILDRSWELIYSVLQHNGANPFLGRTHRALLRESGFADIKASASFDYYATSEADVRVGEFWADFILQPHIAGAIREQGWATQTELEEMSAAFKSWGEHPDAFYARARCEAVGWKK
jgi:ubiquinone/menaquinone biosynthesis C-methylase UbiE